MGSYCDPSTSSFFCYNIPICGGFCAPTKSPEKSCYKHISNEYTIPASRPFMKLAPFIESNACCMGCGKFGCTAAEKHRKPIFTFAILMNAVSVILTLLATMGAVATEASALTRWSWVQGTGDFRRAASGPSAIMNNLTVAEAPVANIYMGVTARYDAVQCPPSGGANAAMCRASLSAEGFEEGQDGLMERVIRWSDVTSCKVGGELCEACKSNLYSVSSLFMSIVTAFPTMATDCQRSTRFGDVNCQATLGFCTNMFSLVSALMPLLSFSNSCYAALEDGGDETTFAMGPGFFCLLIATLIKLVDAICHLVVPTPSARWEKPSREMTDVTDYMMLAVPDAASPDPATTYGKENAAL